MRRLLALLGGIALARAWLARRRSPALPPAEPALSPAEEGDSRAEELRRRLEESRAAAAEQEDFAAGETPVDEADPGERRHDVHERGRAAIDEMRGDD